jgi:ABC-2 type transport system permease protein
MLFFRGVHGSFCFFSFSVLAGYFYYNLMDKFYVENLVTTQKNLDIGSYLITPFMENLAVVLILIIPLITMRSFSEEYRNRTDELLFSVPLSNVEIILAKWVSGMISVIIMLCLTLLYPLFTKSVISIDWGHLLCGYTGLILFSAPLLFIGNFYSSLTESQMISSLMSISSFLFLWFIKYSDYFLEQGFWNVFARYSISYQYHPFARGMLDTSGIAYFAGLSVIAFYLNVYGIEVRRQWE